MSKKEGIFMYWEQYVMKVLSICKIGLKYSKDPFALENYSELEKISLDLLSKEQTYQKAGNFYERDIYPTPNLSVRVIVFNEKNQLLMVKEVMDGKWAVPGGWVDVFDTPSEAAISEVMQETGLLIKPSRVLAIMQRERYKDYPTLVSETVHYFLGEVIRGELTRSHETSEVCWVDVDDLPELSKKTTEVEIRRAIDVAKNHKDTYFE
jgi:8-oxo-dGTP pyrophosphatase MutT (NUDIX family)